MQATPESALHVSIDHLLEGVQVIRFDWTYAYLNDAAARHGQQPPRALLGRSMMACYPGIERTPLFAALERVMQSRHAERLFNEFTYPAGERAWFELRIEPVPDGICVLSLDVTDRQVAEAQLRHAQKVDTVGQFAGGIAHDLNNILTAILGYAALIADQIGPDKPIGRDLQEIAAAGQRGATLTRQLLSFTRKQEPQLAPLSLSAMVEGIEPMLRRLIGAHINIGTVLDAAVPPVLADRGQLEQVLTNLVVNARDAMAGGGSIVITTYVRGSTVVLQVADTGLGMTSDVQARIFEPFFTTKEPGRGTGLGLAAVHSIVTQLGGVIDVDSELGHGTVIQVSLPVTHQHIAPVAQPVKTGQLVGDEHILLVEDEPSVRSFTREVLERHGYAVSDAASGEAAIALMGSTDASIHLLVTDLQLAGIDGRTLAEWLRRERPALPVLFMSGYEDPAPAWLPRDAAMLAKPFTAQMLLDHIRTLLD